MERSGLNTEQVHLLTQAKTWVKRDVNLSSFLDVFTLKNLNGGPIMYGHYYIANVLTLLSTAFGCVAF